MIRIASKLLTRLAERYLVANTPPYLLKHYKSDPGVQQLSETYTAEELVNEIVRVDQLDERTLEDVALAYAATVALTFKKADSVLEALRPIQINRLEWVGAILAIWNTERKTVRVATIDITPNPIIQSSELRSGAAVSLKTLKLGPTDD